MFVQRYLSEYGENINKAITKRDFPRSIAVLVKIGCLLRLCVEQPRSC